MAKETIENMQVKLTNQAVINALNLNKAYKQSKDIETTTKAYGSNLNEINFGV